METVSHLIVGLICLGLFIGGGILTVWSYGASEGIIIFRLFAPVGLFLLLMISYVVFSIMTLFDPNYSISLDFLFKVLGGLLGVGVIFSLKNIVAPLFVALTLAWAIYNGVVHSEWLLIPVYAFIIDFLLFWAPDWVQVGYIWASLLYLVAASFSAFGVD